MEWVALGLLLVAILLVAILARRGASVTVAVDTRPLGSRSHNPPTDDDPDPRNIPDMLDAPPPGRQNHEL